MCTLSQQRCSIDRALNQDNFDDQTLDARFDFTEDTSSDSMSIDKEGSVASLVRFGCSLHQDQTFRCACCAQQGYPLP